MSKSEFFGVGRVEHVFIHPRLPAPRTTARLLEVRDDSARIALGAEPAEGAWFTWRVDEGAWQLARDGGELRVQALAAGEHRLEVRAWNADLTPDPAGASVSFRVEFETAALLHKLLAQLAADDLDQREAAARSLVRLGSPALPAIEPRDAKLLRDCAGGSTP